MERFLKAATEEIRTLDTRIFSPLLYRLSYSGYYKRGLYRTARILSTAPPADTCFSLTVSRGILLPAAAGRAFRMGGRA